MVTVDRVHARARSAPPCSGEIEVGASRTLALDRVEKLKADIETAVKAAVPNAEIGVIVDVRALDDESVMERVLGDRT